jgi:hypothetical protein
MNTGQELYLDLMKKCLTAYLYDESSNRQLTVMHDKCFGLKRFFKRALLRLAAYHGLKIQRVIPFDPHKREYGRDWPGFGYTMIGLKRLDNLQSCIESVLANGVPGDLIEAGVWRGGATIFMRAVLRVHGVEDRNVWVADSFEGMPTPNTEKCGADKGYDLSGCEYLRVTLEDVKANFERFGLFDERVKFLKGWFQDTLPNAPVDRLAVLRIDCDLYESTMDVLSSLYARVSKGGYVIIDDYYSWPPCRQAVDDFRRNISVSPKLEEVDGRGVFWQVT